MTKNRRRAARARRKRWRGPAAWNRREGMARYYLHWIELCSPERIARTLYRPSPPKGMLVRTVKVDHDTGTVDIDCAPPAVLP